MQSLSSWRTQLTLATLLLLYPLSLRADTVTAMVQRVTGAWATNSVILLYPSNTPAVFNGGFALSASARMTVGSNGWASNNLLQGNYRYTIDQSTRDYGTVYVIGDGGTYNLWSLNTSTNVAFASNISAFITGVWTNNVPVAGNGARLNFFGASVFATNNTASNTVDVTITATGGGGGGSATNAIADVYQGTSLVGSGLTSQTVTNGSNTIGHAALIGSGAKLWWDVDPALTNLLASNAIFAATNAALRGSNTLRTDLDAEITRANTSEGALTNYSAGVSNNLTAEITRANAAEAALTNFAAGVSNVAVTASNAMVANLNGLASNLVVTAAASMDVALSVTNVTGNTNELVRINGTNGATAFYIRPNGEVYIGNLLVVGPGGFTDPALRIGATNSGFSWVASNRIDVINAGFQAATFNTANGSRTVPAFQVYGGFAVNFGSYMDCDQSGILSFHAASGGSAAYANPFTNRMARVKIASVAQPNPTNEAWIEFATDTANGVLAIRGMADGTNQTTTPLHLSATGTNTSKGILINTNGAVGVGTNNPAAGLHVGNGGSAIVDGSLTAGSLRAGSTNVESVLNSFASASNRIQAAITNLVNSSTNGSGWVGLLRSTNNGDALIKTLTGSGAITLTDNGTNIDINTSGASGEANVNGEVSVTNSTRIGLVNGKASVTNLLRSLQGGNGIVLTNQGTNIMEAIDPAVVGTVAAETIVSNWVNAVSNYVTAATNSASVTNWINSRQAANAVLTNIVGLADNTYTNVPKGGTNISVRTTGGTNFIDTMGQLNNWSQLSTNVIPLIPGLITNFVTLEAGALQPYGGSTADGGRLAATAMRWTNGAVAFDAYYFDADTNGVVTWSLWPGPDWAGLVSLDVEYVATNALNGASNVVHQLGVAPYSTNQMLSAFTYQTNTTDRFWSSNTFQRASLPMVTLTNYVPGSPIEFAYSRLGTNTADEAAGGILLTKLRLGVVVTNWIGGFR